METLGAVQPGEMRGHVDAGGFAGTVGEPAVVFAVEVDVVEADGAVAVGGGGDADDARVEGGGRAGEKEVFEEVEEEEVGEVVCAELKLVAVFGAGFGGVHDLSRCYFRV